MQRNINLVDLAKSFQTSIYLQKSASIQPRTSYLIFFNFPSLQGFNFHRPPAPANTSGFVVSFDSLLLNFGRYLIAGLFIRGGRGWLAVQTLEGSLSAVWTATLARKDAFFQHFSR